MADVRRDTRLHVQSRRHNALTSDVSHASVMNIGDASSLTAAAQVITEFERYRPLWRESWQDEAWSFYESLGEFNYGVEWFAEALSRVRLTAAKVVPGSDEPETLKSGSAAEIIENFLGGVDGRSQLLRSLGVQLSVVGDAYLIGRQVTESDARYGLLMDAEPDESGNIWTVNPINTLRRHRGRMLNFARRQDRRYAWELRVDDNAWVPLSVESLVVRIWDRNEHEPWRAMSPARAALPIMREIDMYNRHIIASLVSRVAMNGMLFIPDEVTLPASPQYENASDPFIAEMLDIMMAAIKNPGAPAAAAPMPVRIPAEYIEKFKHLTFASGVDGKVFESRADAIRRLAATLNLPAEIITGMGDVNHWSSWNLTENAIKIHIAPKIELITRALTIGYLHPMLKAAGESTRDANGSRLIVWYDTTELSQRPDRSTAAIQLRELMIISDAATRRETGFAESDAPTKSELADMILMKLALDPQFAPAALKELTGVTLESESVTAPSDTDVPPTSGASVPSGSSSVTPPSGASQRTTPSTSGEPPPPPDEGIDAITASSRRDHLLTFVQDLRRESHSGVRVGGDG